MSLRDMMDRKIEREDCFEEKIQETEESQPKNDKMITTDKRDIIISKLQEKIESIAYQYGVVGLMDFDEAIIEWCDSYNGHRQKKEIVEQPKVETAVVEQTTTPKKTVIVEQRKEPVSVEDITSSILDKAEEVDKSTIEESVENDADADLASKLIL